MLSCLGHKEHRFLLPVLPIASLYTGEVEYRTLETIILKYIDAHACIVTAMENPLTTFTWIQTGVQR